jgi:hypothetical protein
MSITGLGTVIMLVLGAAVTLAFTVLGWDWRRARRTRRAVGLLLCQLLLLLSIGAAANRQLRWFSSWSDLLGASSRLSMPASAHARLDEELAQISARRQPGHGSILDWVLTGQSSQISQRAKVYLPADYFTAAGQKAQFPVIELLAGFPGGPDTWIHPLRIGPILDTEIAAGRMAPTIVVMPVQNVSAWQDSECVNAQHGPQPSLSTLLETPPAVLITES